MSSDQNTPIVKHRVRNSSDRPIRFYKPGEPIVLTPGIQLEVGSIDVVQVVRRVLNFAFAIGSYDAEAYEAELKNISDHENKDDEGEYFDGMLDDIVAVLNDHNETEAACWMIYDDSLFYEVDEPTCRLCDSTAIGFVFDNEDFGFCDVHEVEVAEEARPEDIPEHRR